MQTGVPLLQAMVPRRHGLPGTVQVIPVTQAAQVPFAAHTMSVPQEVPAGTLVLVSVQAGAAPEQFSVPVWHLFVGVQAPPDWQGAHVPTWQTIPVPHMLPFGLLFVSVQTGAPVVQTMLPTRHGLPVTSHAMPSVHMPQVPLPQTMFVPQTVPFACVSVSSMHVIAPSLQTNIPLRHGLAGTHAPPATQLLTGTSTAPESTNTVSPPPASNGLVLPPVPVALPPVPELKLPPVPAAASTPAELPPMPAVPPSLP